MKQTCNDKARVRETLRLVLFVVAVTGLFYVTGCSQDVQSNGTSVQTTVPADQDAQGDKIFDPEEAVSGLPEVLAKVNGEPITREEMRRLLADPLALGQVQAELDSQNSATEELRRVALKMLIQRRLILDEAGRRNIAVSDKEVDDAVMTLRGRFEDLPSFGAWMQLQGVNEETLFDVLRDELLAARMREALLKDVQLTDQQVQDYYDAHKEDLAVGEEVRLQIIAVSSRAEAEEIVKALQGGASFARLAQERSQGKRAAQGGDTGWVDATTLTPSLKAVVGTLKPGDAGGPFQSGAEEYLIVGLQGRRPILAKDRSEARPEIERRLLRERQQEAIDAWMAEQEEKATIELFL